MKPTMLICYDYEMEPWQERVSHSPSYLLHQALEEFFDIYTIDEKDPQDVDFVINLLPLGKDDRFFRVGKKTLFWNSTPLEGLMESAARSADVVLCAVPSFTEKYGEKGRTLLHGLNPAYEDFHLEKKYDVGFLGSEVEAYRIDFLNELEEKFSLIRGATNLGQESAYKLSQAQLTLSIEDWHHHNAGIEHRFWTFGNVRPILVHKTPDYELAGFEDSVHYLGYENPEDCIRKIEQWLNHANLTEAIGDNLKWELQTKHTYRHRAEEVYNICKQI